MPRSILSAYLRNRRAFAARPRSRGLGAGMALGLAIALASGGAESQGAAELHRDHPLVGVIWSTGDREAVGRAEALDRLAGADLVILGETHDNPDHHRLQAEFIEELVERGRRPSVVFEMIPEDMQPDIDGYLAAEPEDGAGLGPAVTWEARGWPDWSIYQPIADVAIENGLAIIAGGLSDTVQRSLMQDGVEGLDAGERDRLGLDHALAPAAADSLDEVLYDAHCELIPRESLPAMRQFQRARDGAMASAIEGAAEAGTVMLIAGAGHARRDWGVPAQLAARGAGLDIASLAFVEVSGEETDPGAYLPAPAGDSPVFDSLVFTARAEREDPCAALEERFGDRAGE